MSRLGHRIAPVALFTFLAAGCMDTGKEAEQSVLEMLPGRASQKLEKEAELSREISALKTACAQFNNVVGAGLAGAGVQTKVEGVYYEPEPPMPWSARVPSYDKYKDYGDCVVTVGEKLNVTFGSAKEMADQWRRDHIAERIIEAMPPGDLVKIRDELVGVTNDASIEARDEKRKSLRSYFYRAASWVGVMDLNDELAWGAMGGQTRWVKSVIEAGGDIHAWDGAPLWIAARHGKTDTVKLLLEAGADVHAKNDKALRMAVRGGHVETVEALLEAGADVHAENDEALGMAAFHGHTETVMVLLSAGANVHAQADYALRWARANGHTETTRVLEDWMAREGNSPENGGNGGAGPEIAPPAP